MKKHAAELIGDHRSFKLDLHLLEHHAADMMISRVSPRLHNECFSNEVSSWVRFVRALMLANVLPSPFSDAFSQL